MVEAAELNTTFYFTRIISNFGNYSIAKLSFNVVVIVIYRQHDQKYEVFGKD